MNAVHRLHKECAHRFPVPLYGNDGRKQDKFILTVPQDHLKCVVTLTGDSISHAVSNSRSIQLLELELILHLHFTPTQDISFKVQRAQTAVQRTTINQDSPWKLQQVQDAANHLQQAIHHIDNVDSSYNFKWAATTIIIIYWILIY